MSGHHIVKHLVSRVLKVSVLGGSNPQSRVYNLDIKGCESIRMFYYMVFCPYRLMDRTWDFYSQNGGSIPSKGANNAVILHFNIIPCTTLQGIHK